uniref:Uncharacterized protein n=1 Tax=Oryza rufipogon TaxID=4529 RepID=A0A0E0NYZ3_ORYRU
MGLTWASHVSLFIPSPLSSPLSSPLFSVSICSLPWEQLSRGERSRWSGGARSRRDGEGRQWAEWGDGEVERRWVEKATREMAVETAVARWKASEEMGSALHAVASRRRCSTHCSSFPLCIVGGKNRWSPRTAVTKEKLSRREPGRRTTSSSTLSRAACRLAVPHRMASSSDDDDAATPSGTVKRLADDDDGFEEEEHHLFLFPISSIFAPLGSRVAPCLRTAPTPLRVVGPDGEWCAPLSATAPTTASPRRAGPSAVGSGTKREEWPPPSHLLPSRSIPTSPSPAAPTPSLDGGCGLCYHCFLFSHVAGRHHSLPLPLRPAGSTPPASQPTRRQRREREGEEGKERG